MGEPWVRSEAIEEDAGKTMRRSVSFRVGDMEVKVFEQRRDWMRYPHEDLA